MRFSDSKHDRFTMRIAGSLIALIFIGAIMYAPAFSQSFHRGLIFKAGASQPQKFAVSPSARGHQAAAEPWRQKLDTAARMLIAQYAVALQKDSPSSWVMSKQAPLAVGRDKSGRVMVDLFVQLHHPADAAKLDAMGVTRRTQIGDIVAVRAPIDALQALANEPAVRFIEVSKKSRPLLNDSRVEIRADRVHAGTGLPQAYRGENVIVGVLDSGIDFTHPDFSDATTGTRIQYLLEYTQGGGQNEWTKSQIDNNPGSVTQRDGNGGDGHGTHVTGIAAGGGRLNTAMSGIAPRADIIFIKGIRDPDSQGGFADTDIVDGCAYIFQKAAQLNKPAVINLSLGGHIGPHDGTSLYEQALSGLTGPGKIIVAAGGNEGFDFIHAGGTTMSAIFNETLLFADQQQQLEVVDLWYEAGAISQVAIGAYQLVGNQLTFLGSTPLLPVGQVRNLAPLVINNTTRGYIEIDAQTVQDPNNGDGEVLFAISDNNDPNVDLTETIWSVATVGGQTSGRLDMWLVTNGFFYPQPVGFPNEIEMPGNTDYTVGLPSTARKIISVGSYVTKNTWTANDGNQYQRLNPDPNNPNNTVVPVLGQRSYFSSKGPTRDGRIYPNIAAPGEIIFSALSSAFTQVQPELVLQGGGYQGQNGTSQATPHVAGVIALMLQANRNLTYDGVIQIFTQTARSDAQTGTVPNNLFGAGRIDAQAAVQRARTAVEDREISNGLPREFGLSQNYPNPFLRAAKSPALGGGNPGTAIKYQLPVRSRVELAIFDLYGRRVAMLQSGEKPAGEHLANWNGRDGSGQPAASGIYFYRLEATAVTGAKITLMKKLTILR